MTNYDLIIIGGGAAGLMACASAIRVGKNVLLLEKNSKLGVKILMSGGTRCNITHHCENREIVSAFGSAGRFLHSALAALSPSQVVELIEAAGVPTKVETGGKIFPISDRAIDVRDALVKLASDTKQPGTSTIMTNTACQQIVKSGGVFSVATDVEVYYSNSILITTGGKSYPGCGTTGDGYEWARSLGHEIVQPVAALTPIVNNNFWTRELKGIAFDNVQLQIISENNEVIGKRNGAFLFTHFGYSGPSTLDISKVVSRSPNPHKLKLHCNFEPELSAEQLKLELMALKNDHPKQQLAKTLAQKYPRRFCESLIESLKISTSKKNAELSKQDLNQLVDKIKCSEFLFNESMDSKKAEVTAGGVSLDEIDSRTMESKICQGLYFAGEVIDLDGPIGGYNFQSAFSTGWLAGINV